MPDMTDYIAAKATATGRRESTEFHWQVTGWRATAVGLALLAIPVGIIFTAGFLVGRA